MTYSYQDPTTNSRASIWSMGVFCVLLVVGIVQTLQFNAVLARAGGDPMGVLAAAGELQEMEGMMSMTAVVTVITGLVSGIVFLRWTYIVACNAHSMGSMETTPGWAVGWHFIPFLNLWRPLNAMNEVADVSRPRSRDESALTGLWWTFHITSIVCDRVFSVMTDAAVAQMETNPVGGIESLSSAMSFGSIVNLVLIACNVIACVMVARISGFQVEKYRTGELPSYGGRSERSNNNCTACGEPLSSSDIVCSMCGQRRREERLGLEDRAF